MASPPTGASACGIRGTNSISQVAPASPTQPNLGSSHLALFPLPSGDGLDDPRLSTQTSSLDPEEELPRACLRADGPWPRWGGHRLPGFEWSPLV